jgi:hypothetical protein
LAGVFFWAEIVHASSPSPTNPPGPVPGGQAKIAPAVWKVWWLSASDAASRRLDRAEPALGIALEGDEEEPGVDLAEPASLGSEWE